MDIGAGSGFLTACMARALQNDKNGIVVGIEHQPDLVKKCVDNIMADDSALIESGQVVIIGKYVGSRNYRNKMRAILLINKF